MICIRFSQAEYAVKQSQNDKTVSMPDTHGCCGFRYIRLWPHIQYQDKIYF